MGDKVKSYAKRPIVVQAIKWTGENKEAIKDFTKGGIRSCSEWSENGLMIKTLEGDMLAPVGSYIIQGLKGEFYPCQGDIFEATYDLVDEK